VREITGINLGPNLRPFSHRMVSIFFPFYMNKSFFISKSISRKQVWSDTVIYLDDCPSGSERKGICVPCQQGYYRTQKEDLCVPCDDNDFTTAENGTKSVSGCSISM